MLTHVIDARLTTPILTFRPGNPASFGAIVINRSEKFAAFELEILAAAGNREFDWYRLSPEVSTVKPPGDRTEFRIEIFDSPRPHFVGDVNITVKVSSPQLAQERRLVLRLTVEPTEETSLLKVSLPIQRLQVYPRNTIDIPIRLQNVGLRSAEVCLYLKGIDQAWLVGTAERRLQLQAGQPTEVSFQCCPPTVDRALSQNYQFKVVARDWENTVSATGVLEVLPVGFVQFDVQPSQQRPAGKLGYLPKRLSNIAIKVFQLQFRNASNLLQQVTLEIQEKNDRSCQFKLEPETAELPLAKETSVKLNTEVKRPWIGRVKRLQIEAKAKLSDRRLNIEPATQLLTLKVFPIVPTWLLLCLLALLSTILVLVLQPAPISHVATVNSVRFSGTSGLFPLVLSGSNDCTVRSWTSESSWAFAKLGTLRPQGTLAMGSTDKVCNSLKPESNKGLLAVTGQAVGVLEFKPVDNDQLFVGLEDGTIQAWDVNEAEELYRLKDEQDTTSDRVLSLAFTRNSRHLYSGYGSGAIRKWQIPLKGQPNSNPQLLNLPDRFRFQVWAIALSPNRQVLFSAGQYKSLIRWDLSTPENPIPTQILSPKFGSRGDNDYFWSIAFAQESPNLMATADSDGYVTLWNAEKCQTIGSSNFKDDNSQLPQTKCEIYDRWQASSQAVRSIRFTPDGRKLVSAGDDGKIAVWTIEDNKHDPRKQQVASLSHGITSIDLIVTKEQKILIASGGEDFKVRLHLLK